MICLRCGYCCKHLWVMIVDDPEKGLIKDNIIEHKGGGKPCKHLRGERPGEYSCTIHSKPWYKKTPCYGHVQIERSERDFCRMGKYMLDQLRKEKQNDNQNIARH